MPRQITPREVAQRIANEHAVYLVDVRQPWEHQLAAIPGSVLAPLNELSSRAADLHPPDQALVVVYCHHGIRSLQGAAMLERLGWKNVVSLGGGIEAWSNEVDPAIPRY